MKRLFTTALALVFAALAVWAVSSAVKDPAAKREMERKTRLVNMAKKLELSSIQKDRIEVIMRNCENDCEAELQKAREAVKAACDESNRQIEAILTPEQTRKYEKLEKRPCSGKLGSSF